MILILNGRCLQSEILLNLTYIYIVTNIYNLWTGTPMHALNFLLFAPFMDRFDCVRYYDTSLKLNDFK